MATIKISDNHLEGGDRGPTKSLVTDRFGRSQSLKFPHNLMSAEENHYIRFGVMRTKGTSLSQQRTLGTAAATAKSEEVLSIYLFVPEQISDTFGTNWSVIEAGQVGAAVIDGRASLDNAAIQDILQNKKLLGKEALAKIGGSLFGQDNIDKLFLRDHASSGTLAVNPHAEILFGDVNVRTFSFLFRMSPRTPAEAKTIQQIVQKFKYHSAPSFLTGDAGKFYHYPNKFRIEYHNEENLHRIAPCALTSITTSFNQTSGSNITFPDGRPLETTLSLSFQELSFQTKETFEKGF